MEQRRALIGLHDGNDFTAIVVDYLESKKYCVDLVTNLGEMVGKARTGDYKRYLMDINLENPESPETGPAEEIWEVVRERVEKGLAKFAGVAGTPEAVEVARVKGIPAFHKYEFRIGNFLND